MAKVYTEVLSGGQSYPVWDKAAHADITNLSGNFTAHSANNDMHTTTAEKAAWNAKLGPDALNNYYTKNETSGAEQISGALDALDQQFSAYIDSVAAAIAAGSAAGNWVTTNGSTVLKAVTDVGTVSGDLISLSSTVTAHTANDDIHVTDADKNKWNSYEDNIATLSGDITDLNNDVSTLQGVVDSVQSDVTDLQGDLATLTTTVNDHIDNEDVHVTTADKDKWNSYDGAISVLSGAISEHVDDISNLSDRVDIIETNLDNKADKTELDSYVLNSAFNEYKTSVATDIAKGVAASAWIDEFTPTSPLTAGNFISIEDDVISVSGLDTLISGTDGISAKWDAAASGWNITLDKEEIAYARYTTNSVVAAAEAADITVTGLQEAELYGDKITSNTDSITLQPGLYHADVKLMLQVTTPSPKYEAVKLAAGFSPARSTEIDLDCSYVHNESVCLSFDAMVSEEADVDLSIENLPAGVGYTLSYFNIHEIVNVAGLLTNSQTAIVAGDGLSKDGNELAVKLGGGLKFDNNKNITIAVGNGLKISHSELSTDLELVLDDIAEDTVKEVQQISSDLDEKVTTTYAQANITEAADMTAQGDSTDGNGVLFGYIFSVPIKNKIYIVGDEDDNGKPAEKVTVVGLYCKQAISDASSVIVGLYEYDPSVERNVDGKITYGRTVALCDTGPITILEGYHEYPMKNFNTDNPEIYRPEKALKSSNMYYAAMYISKGVVGGQQLQIASCPGYNTEFHANPQLSVTQEAIGIDIRQEEHRDTSFNDFGFSWKKNADGTYSTNAYHERSSMHRPFMLFRNKKIK